MEVSKRGIYTLFSWSVVFWIIGIMLLVASCKPTARLNGDQVLLSNNRIVTDNISLNKDEMMTILKQKPNRKVIKTYRFFLHTYNFARFFKDSSRFRNWLETSVGEEPVILDSGLTQKSALQLGFYLKNKGYYYSKVTETTLIKKQQGRVSYKIESGKPFKISTYNYKIQDSLIRSFVLKYADESLIHFGDNFDADVLEAERMRITEMLRNNGFYFFTKEFLDFEADTNNYKVNLSLCLKPKSDINLNTITPNVDIYAQYFITQVLIYPGFDTRNPGRVYNDSTFLKGYQFNYNGKLAYRPEVITRSVFFQQGDLYSEKLVNDTYQSLAELKAFRFTNIMFIPDVWDSTSRYLICKIQLSPVVSKGYSISSEGTNSSGNLGVNGNFTFQNKNTYKGAQILTFKLHGALEVQKLLVSDSTASQLSGSNNSAVGNILNQTPIKNTFNTFEIAPSLSYEVPYFWPVPPGFIPKKSRPHTIFTAQYNYLVRPEFTRTVLTVSMAWSVRPFAKSEKWKHIKLLAYPTDLNIVSISKDPVFFVQLVKNQNTNILRSFMDVFIPSCGRFSVSLNTQDINKNSKNNWFIRFDFDQAGALLKEANDNGWIKAKKNSSGSYYLFEDIQGVPKPYAQFVKGDLDLRFYQNFNRNHSFAYRLFSGYAVPYGNSNKSLPFQKSYFSGGTNDVRAFAARTLGPGTYKASDAFDAIGDIKLLGSFEYRFTVFKNWKGAFFTDAGNTWIYRTDASRPGAEFKLNEVYKQLAIGAGLGVRYDFDFFIIRLDFATPIYDPVLPEGERRVYKQIGNKSWRVAYKENYNRSYPVTFNLGIGYPF